MLAYKVHEVENKHETVRSSCITRLSVLCDNITLACTVNECILIGLLV